MTGVVYIVSFSFRESSNKENNSHPEWSFTTVRKKPDAKKLQNGTVCSLSSAKEWLCSHRKEGSVKTFFI